MTSHDSITERAHTLLRQSKNRAIQHGLTDPDDIVGYILGDLSHQLAKLYAIIDEKDIVPFPDWLKRQAG